jgi:hypothetical protein
MRQQRIREEQKNTEVTGRAGLLSEEARVEVQTTTSTEPIQKAESVEDLAGRLCQEVKAHQKALIGGAIGLSGFCVLVMALFDSIGWGWWHSTGFWRIFPLVVIGATAILIYSALKPRKRRRAMANTLAMQEDVRLVGALIDLLSQDDEKMHNIARDALIRLLPRLKASDASLLTEAQRARLYLVLYLPFNPLFKNIGPVFRDTDDKGVEFRLAILKALEQIGDGSALPIVVRLANGKAKTEGQRRIQEAAQDCLPALRQLIQQEGNRQTLLRAAAPSDAAPDTLLRAATSVTSTEPDQLLRSSQSGS